MTLLEMLDCPIGIWIGVPLGVFIAVLISEYAKTRAALRNALGRQAKIRFEDPLVALEWKYPLFYSALALLFLIAIVVGSLIFD